MSRIQNEDIKSVAQLTGGGGTKSQLPNDSKVYLSAFNSDKTLREALEQRALDPAPLRLSAGFPADSKLYFSANTIKSLDGSSLRTPPQSALINDVVSGWVDFQTGTTNGPTFVISFPASTVGQFRRVGFSLKSDGSIEALFTPEAATLGAVANPGTIFVSGALPLGYLDLECTQASPGLFKTAGSATSIIENQVGGTSRLFVFGTIGAGGGAGGSSARSINTQTGTTYTFTISDSSANGNNPLNTFNNASPITVTVPPNSTVAYPIGSQIDLMQLGSGPVTVAPGAGVTIDSYNNSYVLSGKGAYASLIKTATDTWKLTLQVGASSSVGGEMNSMILALHNAENAISQPLYFNQLIDTHLTSKGTIVNASVSGSKLALTSGQTSGSQEVTKEVSDVVSRFLTVTNIAAQALAPKATTIAANTILFDGDVSEFFPTAKNVMIAKQLTSDGEFVHKYVLDSLGNPALFNTVSATYSPGPNETALVLSNPESLDLDLDVIAANYSTSLRVIPFDYNVKLKSDTAASAQSATLIGARSTGTLRIPAEVLDTFTVRTSTLTGSVIRHGISGSPNRVYYFAVALEIQASTAGTYHFYHSKDSGNTWTKYAYTQAVPTSSVSDDSLHGYVMTPNVAVADNGKAFAIFHTASPSLSYHVRGVYSDLSIGSPVVTDSAATGVDAANSVGTAGFISANTTNNRQAWLAADLTDLSFIVVACSRQNDTIEAVRFYTNGGATYQNSDLATVPSHVYGSRVGLAVTGSGSSHRVHMFRKNSTTNIIGHYYDQPSNTSASIGTVATGDYVIWDCAANVSKGYCLIHNQSNEVASYFSFTVAGAPPTVSALRSLNPTLAMDKFVGLDVLENGAVTYNYGKRPGPQIIINPSVTNNVFFITDQRHPDGIVRANVTEIRDDTAYEGINTSYTVASVGAHVELRIDSNYTLSGQTFTPAFTGRVRTASVELKMFGSVTEESQIYAQIYATTGGFPTGAPLATSLNFYDSRFITKGSGSSGQKAQFVFDSVPVTSGTVYGLVLNSNATFNAVNYIGMMSLNSGAYAGGAAVKYDGSVWTLKSAQDAIFEINGEWIYDLSKPADQKTALFDTAFWSTDSSLNLLSSSVLSISTKASPTGLSAVQRRQAGHSYKTQLAIGTGSSASTMPVPLNAAGYPTTSYDVGMALTTSLGTVACGRKDAVTGVVSATDRGEDRSGMNQPATYQSVTVVSDVDFASGQAMEFNTTSSRISYENSPLTKKLHNIGNKFTIEAEVKLNTLPSVKGLDSIIVSQLTDGSPEKGWWLGVDAANRLFFFGVHDAGNIITKSTNTLTTGVKYDVQASSDGSLVRLYINGVEVSYFSQPAVTVTAGAGAGLLMIGNITGTSVYGWGGRIGVVKVSRGSATPVVSGFYSQPETLSPVNARGLIGINQSIGTGSSTINTNFNQWGTAPVSAGSLGVVDSYEDTYLWEVKPVTNPGRYIVYKNEFGRGSNRNISAIYGQITRGFKS